MPELPEVEAVRRSLLRALVGRRVRAVEVRRSEVVTGHPTPARLLRGCVVTGIDRLGKELAILGQSPTFQGCVCVHLGMSGSLQWSATRRRCDDRHVHVVWRFDNGGTLAFRDPRRFGGIRPFACVADRDAQRWSTRGEDALTISPGRLHKRLAETQRAIKAVLLDQAVLAGVGNIYADETLFAAGIHPLTPGHSLERSDVVRLVTAMRRILRRAIGAGGSTLSAGGYVNGDGEAGWFQTQHQAYGRGGQPCRRCSTLLTAIQLSGRTTVFCPGCQVPRASMRMR